MQHIDQIASHAKVRTVLAHWRHLLAQRQSLPRRRDLDACAFMSCLGDMMLLAAQGDGADYRYDLVVENLHDLFAVTYRRRSLLQITFPQYEIVLAAN